MNQNFFTALFLYEFSTLVFCILSKYNFGRCVIIKIIHKFSFFPTYLKYATDFSIAYSNLPLYFFQQSFAALYHHLILFFLIHSFSAVISLSASIGFVRCQFIPEIWLLMISSANAFAHNTWVRLPSCKFIIISKYSVLLSDDLFCVRIFNQPQNFIFSGIQFQPV